MNNVFILSTTIHEIINEKNARTGMGPAHHTAKGKQNA